MESSRELLGFQHLIHIIIMETITDRLKSSLPIHLYGINKAKDFDSLLEEIESGETQIIWDKDKPIRLLKVVRIEVMYEHQYLIEVKQEFSDGRTRSRNIRGLAEKLFPGENWEAAARRAIKEELGIDSTNLEILTRGANSIEENESPSYPGLLSRYEFSDYITDIKGHDYYQTQYVTKEEDTTSFFEWRTDT